MIKAFFRISAILALLICLSGCGVIDYFFIKPPEDSAQELYENGRDSMQEKNYSKAIDYLQKLVDRYPFSPYTPLAELSLGDAYYGEKNYKKSIETYKEFESLHPRHQEIPYVLFKVGLCYYNLFDSIDRPQENANEAVQYFTRVKETYPTSKYAAMSDEYIAKCRRHLAEHEIFIADFYWRASEYQSAWLRYQYVIDNYADVADITEYARKQAKFSYYKYTSDQSETFREDKEGSWKKWFKWL